MDFAQTQRASDIPMEPTFTMDRYSGSGSTNSTIDDSPFGSSLNTPVDEDMLEPFEGIGQRLKELGTLGETKKIESNTAISSMDSERRISASPQPQVPTDQNQSFGSSAAEENFDMSSSFALSDTSAISENLISSFPAVPFSSPEVPTDQFMSKSPSFEAALSRSLRIIQSQSQSAEASPVVVPPTPSILNSTLDESPIFSTPEFEEGFNTHSRASSLYNLPNDPIAISPSMAISDSDSSFYSEVEAMPNASTFAAKTQPAISPSTQNDSQAPQDASDLADLAFEYDPEPSYAFSALRSLDFSPTNVPVLIFKLVCFIPWCALVGATIFLSPANIEKVTFSPGIGFGNRFRLDYVSPPQKGIQRFAYWAEVAIAHVIIFQFCFGVGLYALARMDTGTSMGLAMAVTIGAMAFAQMVIAWQDFDFDLGGSVTAIVVDGQDGKDDERVVRSSSRALGQDDRESIWMLVRMYVMGEESKMWFTGSLEKGIFVVGGGAGTR